MVKEKEVKEWKEVEMRGKAGMKTVSSDSVDGLTAPVSALWGKDMLG